ncbi:MAG: antitoxin [Candidatus Omnitrophica bacterium]|nr:antitoxin [Candidatus Omnitrophota bacterium]
MKKIRLTKEEKKIEDSLMRGEYIKVKGAPLNKIQEALIARKKDRTMTIRVNSDDIEKIKKKAEKIGVKYQSFISEILHQVAQ